MDLVVHHVLQSLVEDRAHEDAGGQLLPGSAAIQDLVAAWFETHVEQHLAETRNRYVSEWTPVPQSTNLAAGPAHEGLHQVRNSHSGGDAVRIDNNVGYNPARCLRHVLRLKDHTHGSLLAVAAAEFVADRGRALAANADLDE